MSPWATLFSESQPQACYNIFTKKIRVKLFSKCFAFESKASKTSSRENCNSHLCSFLMDSLMSKEALSIWGDTGMDEHPPKTTVVVVQLWSLVWLFATPWTAACQGPLSTISQSLLKFMSIESLMLSNHLILCQLLLLLPSIYPASGSFPTSGLFTSGGHRVHSKAGTGTPQLSISSNSRYSNSSKTPLMMVILVNLFLINSFFFPTLFLTFPSPRRKVN